jgi:hypothetical protein
MATTRRLDARRQRISSYQLVAQATERDAE